jgi:hypothetical protein
MPGPRTFLIVALTAFTAVSGCGTIANTIPIMVRLEDDMLTYGGVRKDMLAVRYYTAQSLEANKAGDVVENALYAGLLLGVDTPLSVAGDTLMLPLTLPRTVTRLVEKRKLWDSADEEREQFDRSLRLSPDDPLLKQSNVGTSPGESHSNAATKRTTTPTASPIDPSCEADR